MAHRRAAAACAPSRALVLALACLAGVAPLAGGLSVSGALSDVSLAGAADVTIDGAAAVALVAAHDASALVAVDVSDPAAPALASALVHEALDGAHCVALTRASGSFARAYVASRVADALAVVDVADPYGMRLLGYLQDPVALNGASSVSLYGGYAYVAARGARNLTVVDVSNPADLSVVNVLRVAAATCVKVFGSHLYVAGGDNSRVTILDLATPARPAQLGTLKDKRLKGAAYVHVNTDDSVAYVAMGKESKGLAMLNVEDPSFPKFLRWMTSEEDRQRPGVGLNRGRVVLRGAAQLAPANSTHLFVASYKYVDREGEMTHGGVVAVDVAEPNAAFDAPTMPRVVDSLTGPALEGAEAIAYDGGYVYIASGVLGKLIVLEP